jgi:hypothetical protein
MVAGTLAATHPLDLRWIHHRVKGGGARIAAEPTDAIEERHTRLNSTARANEGVIGSFPARFHGALELCRHRTRQQRLGSSWAARRLLGEEHMID